MDVRNKRDKKITLSMHEDKKKERSKLRTSYRDSKNTSYQDPFSVDFVPYIDTRVLEKRKNKKPPKYMKLEIKLAQKKDQKSTNIVIKSLAKPITSPIITESALFRDTVSVISDLLGSSGFGQLGPTLGPVVSTTISFIYQIWRSRNVADILVSGFQYISSLFSSITQFLKSTLEGFVETIGYLIEKYMPNQFSPSRTLIDIQVFISTLFCSELVQTIRSLVVTFASLRWFSKDMASSIFRHLGKAPSLDTFSLLDRITNDLTSLFRFGEALIGGVSLSQLLTSENPVSSAIKVCNELIYSKDYIYSGVFVEGRVNVVDFCTTYEELKSSYGFMSPNLNPLDPKTQKLKRAFTEATAAWNDVRMRFLNRERRPPFAVILFGDPGIGKSLLYKYILELCSEAVGRKFSDSHVYHRIVTSDYWEGYDPLSQPIIHYSEIGNTSEQLVRTKGDPVVAELTSLIDGLAFPVNMAFGDKGKIFAQPEVVIIDTNDPNMNLDILVKNPSAYRRRFIYVKPVVKPQFRIHNGLGIDVKASNASPLPLLDRWTFTVYREVPTDLKRSIKDDLFEEGETKDIYGFTSCMRRLIAEHLTNSTYADQGRESETKPLLYNCQPIRSEIGFFEQPDIENMPANLRSFFQFGSNFINPHSYANLEFLTRFANKAEVFSLLYMMGSRYWDYTANFLKLGVGLLFYAFIALIVYFIHWTPNILVYGIIMFLSLLVPPLYLFGLGPYGCIPVIFIVNRFVLPNREFVTTLWRHYRRYSRVREQLGRMRMLLSFRNWDNPLESQWWRDNRKNITVALSTLSALFLSYKLMKHFDAESGVTAEASADLAEDTDMIKETRDLETRFGCGTSYIRIPNNMHPQWNVASKPMPLDKFTGNPEDLLSVVSRSVRSCLVIRDGKVYTTHIFGIHSNFALINTHVIKGALCVLKVSVNGKATEARYHKETILYPSRVLHLNGDVSLVSLEGMLFKDWTHLVPDLKVVDGSYTTSFWDGDLGINVGACKSGKFLFNDKNTGDFTLDTVWQYPFPKHYPGACGLPLIARLSNGASLVAIHSGGQDKFGFGTPLDRSEILKGIEELSYKQPMFPLSSEGGLICGNYSPHRKSPLRYEIVHGFEYLGSLGNITQQNKRSKATKLAIADEVETVFREKANIIRTKEFGAPMMLPTRKGGEYKAPYNVALNEMSGDGVSLDPDILGECVKEMFDRVKTMLPQLEGKLKPLTVEAALNGAPGDPYIKHMNFSTSAGYGFNGIKKDHLDIVDPENNTGIPKPHLLKSINNILNLYMTGATVCPVNTCSLKDEVVSLEKAVSGKTRVFFVPAFDHLIVQRMFLAPLISLIVEFGEVFCASVGINMHMDTDKFIRKMKKFSDKRWEGDYRKFDIFTPFSIGWAAETLIYLIAIWGGYSTDALKILRGIMTDALFPVFLMVTDFFMRAAQIISGCYGTAERNCIRGLFLLMYAYYFDRIHPKRSFFKNVKPDIYGDDLISTIKPHIVNTFNAIIYRDLCKKLYNMDLTASVKDRELTPLTEFDDSTFLKRSFFLSPQGVYYSRLDPNSIIRSLTWTVATGKEPLHVRLTGALTSAFWELYFHLDVDTWNAVVSDLTRIFSAEYFGCYTPILPRYCDIHKELGFKSGDQLLNPFGVDCDAPKDSGVTGETESANEHY